MLSKNPCLDVCIACSSCNPNPKQIIDAFSNQEAADDIFQFFGTNFMVASKIPNNNAMDGLTIGDKQNSIAITKTASLQVGFILTISEV